MGPSIYEAAFPKAVLAAPSTVEKPAPPPATPALATPPPLAVPREVLRLAAACDSGPDLRKVDLRQVRFGRDAKGCYAVATDSKIMAVAHWDELGDGGGPCDFGVSGRLVAVASKVVKHLAISTMLIEASPGSITVTANSTNEFKQHFRFADAAEIGRFPDWRPILDYRLKQSATEEGGALRVAPDLWTLVGTLFGNVIGDDEDTSIRIRYTPSQKPILYESVGPSPVRLTVLLMPLAEPNT